ncbi:hypothetical protein RJ639_006341, partial [Escallonia herrerae]
MGPRSAASPSPRAPALVVSNSGKTLAGSNSGKSLGVSNSGKTLAGSNSGKSLVMSNSGKALVVSNSGKALGVSSSGKRMDKKKYVKQVTGRHNDTELHLAAQRGDVAAVRRILGDIDEQMLRTTSGAEFDAEVAEIREAVVNEVNELGETALFTAAERGHIEVVKELLMYTTREGISLKNRSGFDPLHIAASHGHQVVLVQITVVRGEIKSERRVVEVINKLMWLASVCTTVAFIASSYIVVGRHNKWAAILVTVVGGVTMAGVIGTMTYYVVKSKRTRKVRKREKYSKSGTSSWRHSDFSESEEGKFLQSNLMGSMGRAKTMKHLLDKRDDTPLHSAVRAENLELIIEILTGSGENELKELLSKQNQPGETALYVAAECGHVNLVKEMVKYHDSCSAGIKCRNGYDAFHIAAKQGDL